MFKKGTWVFLARSSKETLLLVAHGKDSHYPSFYTVEKSSTTDINSQERPNEAI
jgi:hypothetical protein